MELTHDEDWFAIDLEQRTYAVSTVAGHELSLFASDGMTRPYWNPPDGLTPPSAGRYLFRVRYAPHFSPPFTGDQRYSFTVSPR